MNVSQASPARISLRIDLASGRIGPGKIALLERIAEEGSISAAARLMGMSYKRAWDLVEETARTIGRPVVETRSGGRSGGGAKLTSAGLELVRRFRTMEGAATAAAGEELEAFLRSLESRGAR